MEKPTYQIVVSPGDPRLFEILTTGRSLSGQFATRKSAEAVVAMYESGELPSPRTWAEGNPFAEWLLTSATAIKSGPHTDYPERIEAVFTLPDGRQERAVIVKSTRRRYDYLAWHRAVVRSAGAIRPASYCTCHSTRPAAWASALGYNSGDVVRSVVEIQHIR